MSELQKCFFFLEDTHAVLESGVHVRLFSSNFARFRRNYRVRDDYIDADHQQQGKTLIKLTELFTQDAGDRSRVPGEQEVRPVRLESHEQIVVKVQGSLTRFKLLVRRLILSLITKKNGCINTHSIRRVAHTQHKGRAKWEKTRNATQYKSRPKSCKVRKATQLHGRTAAQHKGRAMS